MKVKTFTMLKDICSSNIPLCLIIIHLWYFAQWERISSVMLGYDWLGCLAGEGRAVPRAPWQWREGFCRKGHEGHFSQFSFLCLRFLSVEAWGGTFIFNCLYVQISVFVSVLVPGRGSDKDGLLNGWLTHALYVKGKRQDSQRRSLAVALMIMVFCLRALSIVNIAC